MADGLVPVDTIIGSTTVIVANVAIKQINYDFYYYYFALVDQMPHNITTGVTLTIGALATVLNPQIGYTYTYNTYVGA